MSLALFSIPVLIILSINSIIVVDEEVVAFVMSPSAVSVSIEFKILSISFSNVIYCSITSPLFNNNILTGSGFPLIILSVKATFIFPLTTSNGIHLFFLHTSKER